MLVLAPVGSFVRCVFTRGVGRLVTVRLQAQSRSLLLFSVIDGHFEHATGSDGMAMDGELSSVLNRRQAINNALDEGEEVKPLYRVRNVYTEFHEFSRKQIKQYERTFQQFDVGKDGFLDLEELKKMMEKIGAPQTHLGLKTMIKEIDEDGDGKISFREFLLIYRKAEAGELMEESGLSQLARLTEINVDEVGVNGAKNFFEAKIEEINRRNRFEEEIRAEQNERKKEEEEKIQRRLMFKERAAKFQCA